MTFRKLTDTELKLAARHCHSELSKLDLVLEVMRRTGHKTAGEALRWLGVVVDTPDGPCNA